MYTVSRLNHRRIFIFSAATISGLQKEMNEAVSVLNRTDYSKTSVTSASELFMRFITLAALDQSVN